MPLPAREQSGLRAVDLGLAANAVLAGLKTSVGVVGHSPALLADGINSVADVVYYVVVRVFMVLARKPADAEHPYGHERLETIGALVVGSFVVATGVAVLLNAAHQVFELAAGMSEYAGAEPWALWAALFTIAVKIALTGYTRVVGRRTGNLAVMALALDHRNDVLSAGAAAMGIWVGRAGHPWVDPAAAGLVALVILKTGVDILRESSDALMGGQPGRDVMRQVTAWLNGVEGVAEVQQVRAHFFGPYIVLNLTIGVDGTLTVAAGDAIADEVERVLHERVEYLRSVHVHYHPVGRAPPRTRSMPSPEAPA
jgi:cation diffusion facilitator family transporter